MLEPSPPSEPGADPIPLASRVTGFGVSLGSVETSSESDTPDPSFSSGGLITALAEIECRYEQFGDGSLARTVGQAKRSLQRIDELADPENHDHNTSLHAVIRAIRWNANHGESAVSDPIPPEQPEEADSFRKVAIGYSGLADRGDDATLADELNALDSRLAALLAAEDEHPATPVAEVEKLRLDLRRAQDRMASMEAFMAHEGYPIHRVHVSTLGFPTMDVGEALDDVVNWVAAPVDEHPPTFHVRAVWVHKDTASPHFELDQAPHPSNEHSYTKNWRWGAKDHGEVVIPESQALEHRQHALHMAHKFADPLGARVVDEDGNDV